MFSYENKEEYLESLNSGIIKEEILRYLYEGFEFCDNEREYLKTLSDEYMLSLVELEYGICKTYVFINWENIDKYKNLRDVILSARNNFLKQIGEHGVKK